MKFSVVLAFVAAATVVSAESNGFRFARGMGPMAPARRSTKTNNGKGSKPSSTPGGGNCGNGGKQQCCDTAGTYGGSNSEINNAVGQNGLLGLVNIGSLVGLNCVVSATTCSQQNLCCKNSKGEAGLINWDCTNLNLL